MKPAGQYFEGRTAEVLQELVLSSGDLEEFLGELAQHSANGPFRAERQIICAVTVLRPKKPATIGASSQRAFELEELQAEAGEGPSIAAMSGEALRMRQGHDAGEPVARIRSSSRSRGGTLLSWRSRSSWTTNARPP